MSDITEHYYDLAALLTNEAARDRMAEALTSELVENDGSSNGLPNFPTYTVMQEDILPIKHRAATLDVLLVMGERNLFMETVRAHAERAREKNNDNTNLPDITFERAVAGLLDAEYRKTDALREATLKQYNQDNLDMKAFLEQNGILTRARELLDEAHEALCPDEALSLHSQKAQDRLAKHNMAGINFSSM